MGGDLWKGQLRGQKERQVHMRPSQLKVICRFYKSLSEMKCGMVEIVQTKYCSISTYRDPGEPYKVSPISKEVDDEDEMKCSDTTLFP